MTRIIIGVVLVIWAIFVWLNNYDFWDGYVFPTVASSAGVYLILSGREKLVGENRNSPLQGGPDPSAASPGSEDAVPSPLPTPSQPGSSGTTSGEGPAQKIVMA
jgi:hypothetical protein